MPETGPSSAGSWYSWHAPYDDLGSAQTDRLAAVQHLLDEGLSAAPVGPLRVVSACAGQARDLLPVLIHHPRGSDVTARIIDAEPLNVAFVNAALGSTGLADAFAVAADAGTTGAYAGAAPADLVVLCGVFTNVALDDARSIVAMLPALCVSGGLVVWSTYGRGAVDTDRILGLFDVAEFDLVDMSRSPDRQWSVGAHRYTGPGRPLPADERFFRFVGLP